MPQPKENSPIKRDILFRVHLLYAAFVLIAALVFARLIWVQLFSSEVAYNAERLEATSDEKSCTQIRRAKTSAAIRTKAA